MYGDTCKLAAALRPSRYAALAISPSFLSLSLFLSPASILPLFLAEDGVDDYCITVKQKMCPCSDGFVFAWMSTICRWKMHLIIKLIIKNKSDQECTYITTIFMVFFLLQLFFLSWESTDTRHWDQVSVGHEQILIVTLEESPLDAILFSFFFTIANSCEYDFWKRKESSSDYSNAWEWLFHACTKKVFVRGFFHSLGSFAPEMMHCWTLMKSSSPACEG